MRFPSSQPTYLTGRVLLDDGSVPPESVVIQRICGGSPLPQGYTDGKGRFSIDPSRNPGVILDASSEVDRRGLGGPCELKAYLPGFQSSSIPLAGRKFMDHPDVGTIFLKRIAQVEGLTITATSAMAPKDARKAFERAREAERKGKRQ